jgi:SAM-dependent methyltransferase
MAFSGRIESVNREQASVRDWLATPLGRRCLANEERLIRHALERVFGEQFLQIGRWGDRHTFLRYARTQRRALADWRPGADADLITDPEQLAIASDSVDAVLLPHALEQTASPHALLREVDRVLRADGHLILLCFAPGGLWGLRHLLELLSFEVGEVTRFCHTLPLDGFKQLRVLPREERAHRWLPMLGAGFMLRAQKRVRPLTPVHAWKPARLRVVGGLVEPTTRSSLSITHPAAERREPR